MSVAWIDSMTIGSVTGRRIALGICDLASVPNQGGSGFSRSPHRSLTETGRRLDRVRSSSARYDADQRQSTPDIHKVWPPLHFVVDNS